MLVHHSLSNRYCRLDWYGPKSNGKEKKKKRPRSRIEKSGHSATCHREPQSQPTMTAAWLLSSVRHNLPAKCAIVFVPCHRPSFYQSEEWPHQLQPALSAKLAAPELRNCFSTLCVPSVLSKGETGSKCGPGLPHRDEDSCTMFSTQIKSPCFFLPLQMSQLLC